MGTVLGFDAIAFWIVATGVLVAVPGALLGSYLVLRRMSLVGDAISHAVLPGLAAAFLVTGTRSPLAMLAGAAVAGLVTVALTELLRRHARVAEDAALGVVFTSLFALGVLMIGVAAERVDLDADCVLYGMLEIVPLDTVPVAGLEVPRTALHLGVVLAVVAAFFTAFWKEIRVTAFDPGLARSLGIPAGALHGALMFGVAAFTVMAFEAVGSILVVALMVVPPAAAWMLADRMGTMVLLAMAIGASSAVLGRQAALAWDTTVAGSMAVVAGLHLAAAVLLGPRHGVLARRLFQGRVALRVAREDVLGLLWRWRESRPGAPMPEATLRRALGGGLLSRLALRLAVLEGRVRREAGGVSLTAPGADTGGELVRRHRLWESWLAAHSALPGDHLHGPADRVEHFIDAEMADRLAADAGHPERDPHGRPIGR